MFTLVIPNLKRARLYRYKYKCVTAVIWSMLHAGIWTVSYGQCYIRSLKYKTIHKCLILEFKVDVRVLSVSLNTMYFNEFSVNH